MKIVTASKPLTNYREIINEPHEFTDIHALLDDKHLPEELTHIWLNGEYIPKERWSEIAIDGPGHLLVRAVPMGGDTGKDVLRTVALIAVAILVPQFGFVANLTKGASTWATVAAVALDTAIVLAATFAVNALIPLPKPEFQDSSVSSRQNITGIQNSANRYGSIPVIHGTRKLFPMFAAQPYTEPAGPSIYLRVLFCVGYGPLILSDLKIGDTPIGDFTDVQYNVFQGFEDDTVLSLYTSDISEDAFSIKLNGQSGAWQQRTTEAGVDEAIVDVAFPAGIVKFNDDGSTSKIPKTVNIQYRLVGAGSWTAASNIYVNTDDRHPFRRAMRIVFPSNGQYEVRVRDLDDDSTTSIARDAYFVALRSVKLTSPVALDGLSLIEMRIRANDQLNGVVDSLNVIAQAYLPAWNGTSWVSSGTNNPASAFLSVLRGSANARPQLGTNLFTASDASGFGSNNSNSVSVHWDDLGSTTISSQETIASSGAYALRLAFTDSGGAELDVNDFISAGDFVAQDRAVITFKIRHVSGTSNACAYLTYTSGVRQTVIATVTSSDTGWVEVIAPFTYGTSGSYRSKLGFGDVSGSGTSTVEVKDLCVYNYEDYPIDLDRLQTWYESNESDGYEFNFVQEQSTSVYDAVNRIASAGRASHAIYDGRHTVIQDKPQSIPIQHFTPANSSGFKGSRLFPEEIHGVKVRFYNEEADYQEDEIIVYDDGYSESNASKFTSLDMPGVTNPNQIWKSARYYMAVFRLRPEEFELNVDLEHIACTRGDLVRVSNDVPLIGLGFGRVTSADANGFTVDSPVTMEVDKTYAVRFRLSNGDSLIEPVDLDVGSQTELTFTNAPISTYPESDDLFMFGESGVESAEFLVKGILTGEDMSATLILEPYSPAVYDADTGTIPDYDPVITMPAELRTPHNPVFRYITTSANPVSFMFKTVQPVVNIVVHQPSGVVPVVKWECQYRAGDEWRSAPDSAITVLTISTLEFGKTYDFRFRAVSAIGRTSAWVEELNYTVEFTPLSPAAPTSLVATQAGTKSITWTWNWPLDQESSLRATGIDRFELWASSSNDRSLATKLYEGLSTSYTVTQDTPVELFTWVRTVSVHDETVNSTWYPVSSTAGVSSKSAYPLWSEVVNDNNNKPEDNATLGAGNTGEVLARNVNFESGDVHWGKEGTWAITTSAHAHQGSKVASYSANGGSGALINSVNIPVVPGERFVIGGYVKCAAGTVMSAAGVRIRYLDINLATVTDAGTSGYVNVTTTSVATTYSSVKGIVSVPSGLGVEFIRLEGVAYSVTSGGVYLDDLFIRPANMFDDAAESQPDYAWKNTYVTAGGALPDTFNAYLDIIRPDNRPAGWYSVTANVGVPVMVPVETEVGVYGRSEMGITSVSTRLWLAGAAIPNSRWKVKVHFSIYQNYLGDIEFTVAEYGSDANQTLPAGKVAVGVGDVAAEDEIVSGYIHTLPTLANGGGYATGSTEMVLQGYLHDYGGGLIGYVPPKWISLNIRLWPGQRIRYAFMTIEDRSVANLLSLP